MYPETFTIQQLSYETGISARRIRNWIQKGIVPRATHGTGRYGGYTREHIRIIRRVAEDYDNNVSWRDLRDRYNPPPWRDE